MKRGEEEEPDLLAYLEDMELHTFSKQKIRSPSHTFDSAKVSTPEIRRRPLLQATYLLSHSVQQFKSMKTPRDLLFSCGPVYGILACQLRCDAGVV